MNNNTNTLRTEVGSLSGVYAKSLHTAPLSFNGRAKIEGSKVRGELKVWVYEEEEDFFFEALYNRSDLLTVKKSLRLFPRDGSSNFQDSVEVFVALNGTLSMVLIDLIGNYALNASGQERRFDYRTADDGFYGFYLFE